MIVKIDKEKFLRDIIWWSFKYKGSTFSKEKKAITVDRLKKLFAQAQRSATLQEKKRLKGVKEKKDNIFCYNEIARYPDLESLR